MVALHSIRLRRALSLSYSLLEHSFHGYKAQPISASRLLPASAATTQLMRRPFTSTTTLFRRAFDPETDEIRPDTILFEGCDYKHWLITVDFPKDSNVSREQMIETYVNIATQVFGSVEEAMKRIYALSTTTYQGFQVECPEETSEKFKSIPQVVFVLPDSYIDPVNKEYGGDKYVNGEIYPRPAPVHYGRRSNRDMQPREQNYGRPPQQNFGPPSQQNYEPPPQQNNRQPPQQNYGPPPQQNYGPPPQQNYEKPPQQNYEKPPQQNYRPPPQQNYGPPPQQNYGQPPQQNYRQSPQPNYASPQQQNYRAPQQGDTPQQHQSYGTPSQQSYMPKTQGSYGNSPNVPTHPNNTSGHDGRNSAPSYQGNFNQAEFETDSAQGQGELKSRPRGQMGFPQDANYGSSQDGPYGQVSGGYRPFGQVSGEYRNFSSSGNN